MKRLIQTILLISLIVLTSGCQTGNLSVPTTKPKIDENLPTIDSKTIRTISDMTSVALEWKTTPTPEVQGYAIYRSDVKEDGPKLKRVKTIHNKYVSHYLDTDLEPNTKYIYAISSINKDDYESVASKSVVVQTQPRFESVSFISAVNELPRQIKVLWRPHSNPRVAKYIIQRRDSKTAKWSDIKTIDSRLIVEYIDDNLKDNKVFSYRIISVTFDGIHSKPSQIVQARTKPLPKPLNDISATLDQPQRIVVSWHNDNEQDVEYYNIYSSNSSDGYFTKLAQVQVGVYSYTDMIPHNNKVRFYKVVIVDKDNLEGSLEIPAIMGKTLEAPAKPIITLAQIQGDIVILNWKSTDNRAVSYNIYKVIKESFFSKKLLTVNNIKTLRFEDKDIVRGVVYEYSIEAVDKFGLTSKKTLATSLTLPKLDENIDAPSSTNQAQ